MNAHSKEIISAGEKLGVSVCLLTATEMKAIRNNVEAHYAQSGSLPLWERLCDHKSVHNASGWRLLDFFLTNEQVIVFFNEDEDPTAIQLKAQTSLTSLLNECSGFEFYLTDVTASYLLCFNHHDVLIGCGRAKEWVEQIN